MKIIDLLNKIANGEEVPEKFKFKGRVFEFDGARYVTNDSDEEILDYIISSAYLLNAEVEIIEEDKDIKKLNAKYTSQIGKLELANKIDELIDEVKKLKNKQ